VNRNGEPRIAYNGGPLVPASIDHQSKSLLMFSSTAPDHAVSIVIARGDPGATTVVLSDAYGQVRILGAECDGRAY
jgi:hypothetical protein